MTTTTLYRMLDRKGQLLYVGISGNVGRRMAQHADDKNWWTAAAMVALEHFPTRDEAEAAEIAAISREQPVYNKAQRSPSFLKTMTVDRSLVQGILNRFEIKVRLPEGIIADLVPCRHCGRRRPKSLTARFRDGLCAACYRRS